jgi:hypothetical protein
VLPSIIRKFSFSHRLPCQGQSKSNCQASKHMRGWGGRSSGGSVCKFTFEWEPLQTAQEYQATDGASQVGSLILGSRHKHIEQQQVMIQSFGNGNDEKSIISPQPPTTHKGLCQIDVSLFYVYIGLPMWRGERQI